jgi:hypothetical protein
VLPDSHGKISERSGNFEGQLCLRVLAVYTRSRTHHLPQRPRLELYKASAEHVSGQVVQYTVLLGRQLARVEKLVEWGAVDVANPDNTDTPFDLQSVSLR